MKMNGEKIINAPKQDVWDALNNPEKLKLAIPGAENVEKKDENNLTATVKTKIGPISAKFTGNIVLSNINPPTSYTLTGEGTGGDHRSCKRHRDAGGRWQSTHQPSAGRPRSRQPPARNHSRRRRHCDYRRQGGQRDGAEPQPRPIL